MPETGNDVEEVKPDVTSSKKRKKASIGVWIGAAKTKIENGSSRFSNFFHFLLFIPEVFGPSFYLTFVKRDDFNVQAIRRLFIVISLISE